jgi:hypothetical protein
MLDDWDAQKRRTRDQRGSLRWPEYPWGTIWSQPARSGTVESTPCMLPPDGELINRTSQLMKRFDIDRPDWEMLRARLTVMFPRTPAEWERVSLGDLLEILRQFEQKTLQPHSGRGKEALAIATLVEHPDWTLEQIAEQVNCNRTSLYRMRKFRKAWSASRAAMHRPTGVKSRDGTLESFSDDEKR